MRTCEGRRERKGFPALGNSRITPLFRCSGGALRKALVVAASCFSSSASRAWTFSPGRQLGAGFRRAAAVNGAWLSGSTFQSREGETKAKICSGEGDYCLRKFPAPTGFPWRHSTQAMRSVPWCSCDLKPITDRQMSNWPMRLHRTLVELLRFRHLLKLLIKPKLHFSSRARVLSCVSYGSSSRQS